MLNKQILVVDDEPRIREVVQYALEREGCRVYLAATAHEAEATLEREAIDLVVLDVMLPDSSGLDLCRRLRAARTTPVLFLSARGEEIDRVIGLEVGADDYLGKPFGTRELVARIKAVLRRAVPATTEVPSGGSSAMELGALVLDGERHEVRARGRVVPLTHTEFLILRALMQRPGVVFERGQLMRAAREDDTHITERTIDTHIRRIRAKLRECSLEPLVTVHGVGYKLDREACSAA